MNESTYLELGKQISDRLRSSQLAYFITFSALTAIIVFGRGDDVNLLLTIAAIGIGVFGILSFDAAQQSFIMLNKSMPQSMEGTPIGEATKNPAQFQFYRVTNAVFTALLVVIQIITIYR
jgi:glucan phosphoethanolaminetransferase (alkaline phosphatase superfamily)